MNIILFDDPAWQELLPLTYTRPVAALRVGILTIREKWGFHLKGNYYYLTQDYIREKFPLRVDDQNMLINGAVMPDSKLVEAIGKLQNNQVLVREDTVLAAKVNREAFTAEKEPFSKLDRQPYSHDINRINYPWDIFRKNGSEIMADVQLLTKNRKSGRLSETNNLIQPENVFVEEGVQAEYVTINASGGPVYLGKGAEIMEGSVIRGPFALCGHSVVKMAAKIYGPTTIGPHSKVGGELNNCVIQGYSNKSHDGFLGNSVLGEWCNLGADTNNSNLKNNYADVKLWNYKEERFVNTGLQFCGLIMGDHSKCGINTMFNTGTVVGVSANIYGSGFPRNFIPSFSWGGAQGFKDYNLKKAFEVAAKVMQRRGVDFTREDESMLTRIFEMTATYRKQ